MKLEFIVDRIKELKESWHNEWVGVRTVYDTCVQRLGAASRDDQNLKRINAILKGGNSIANFVEHSYKKMARTNREPNYHSRLHTAIVIESLTALIQKQRHIDGKTKIAIDLPEATVLVAMVGHDAGHNGTRNGTPCQLESRSFELIQPLLRSANCDEKDINRIKRIIWGTDPNLIIPLHCGANRTEFDLGNTVWQTVICQEADILASVLPAFAEELTQHLADEWRKIDPISAAGLLSTNGRKYFLSQLAKFSTPTSISLGLASLVEKQLAELS